ncbi:hypothetical protein K503DRAFT_806648 [Rhizopogon vinicolor AM-OR11-026]|uniref:Uncharacterized protein n=1 Tax=Rhizopogon vinicolor AM-OR11-026 TaxID=1314800 RepID=A0A1B7ME23_9AGAM|nr:hypothetical protein K503DRAFT_806648 [Rhizopogon vinicolor AM-OR11-026]
MNNPLPVRAIYGTEADLFLGPADAGAWHDDIITGKADMAEDAKSRNVKFL